MKTTSPRPKKNPFKNDPSKKSAVEMKKRMADKSKAPTVEDGNVGRIMTNIEAPLKSKRPKPRPKTK